ncbi:MFS transporter [Agrobacterium vitis]|uniref:MFS transporter n=1 Tax=Agrobacterium vitis TaxID=373 RepID=UPI0012E83C99|nr:MFS transporter [Agrobacterium vitis]MCF1475536.1 MFS transporter [Agrobacterium vitis]MVA30070.1 MFS transporter [Agrobacterium vitis]NSZ47545.1 MFS transporter [Agrobacterium vitis]UJL72227.1 MFS transporter [Agrobacterium vitis]
MKPLSNLTLLFYALPALPLAAIALPLYIIVPSVYAGRFGIALSAIGAALLAIRCLDAITDPLIGWLADRIPGRYGRRRLFFLLSLPLTALSAFMLFNPPDGAGLAHLVVWGCLLSIGSTWTSLPYTAWGAELETSYDGRVRLSAWREGTTLLGTLLAISLPFLGQASTAGAQPDLNAIAVMVAVLLPIFGAIAVWRVAEPVDFSKTRLSLKNGVSFLLANSAFLRLAMAFLANSLANAIPASLFLYFVAARLEAPELQGPLLFAYFLSAVAGVPLAVFVARRLGKHRAWCWAMLLSCAIFALAGLLGPGDAWLFLGICVVTGVLLGFDLALPPAIQADVIDQDTLASGEQRSGLYFAAWSFVTKLALALSSGIVFPLLALAGFQPENATQSGPALSALSALYAFLPILFKLLAIALMWQFSIDSTHQQATRQKIEQRQRDISNPS